MPTLYLIDGHAYIHRAFHALPPLTTSRGEPVGAVYGFVRMILKIMRDQKPDYMAVCFDTPAPTFRHQAFADYKATRKEMDDNLKPQIPLAMESIKAMGMANFAMDGYEADDLIAHMTREGRKKGCEVVIVSGDKDALQLVGPGVGVLNEGKNILFDAEKVKEKWGVLPHQIPDIFALMGDHSDNVPGVPGIGEKTAVKLISEYGSLEKLLASASQVKGKVGTLLQTQQEAAHKSYDLVHLNRDVPMQFDWDALRTVPPAAETFGPFLQRMEFYGLLKEVPGGTASVARTTPSLPTEYQVLSDEKALSTWLAQAKKTGRLAVDVETDGRDVLRCKLVGISLSDEPGHAAYIPVAHQWTDQQLPLGVIQKHLASVLREGTQIYGHNLKFDGHVLAQHGLPLGPIYFDSMIASYVLNPSRNGHGLKDLTLEFLQEQMTRIEELIGKGAKQLTIDQVPIDKVAPYACADADMSLRLADHFAKELKSKELDTLFHTMEMPLLAILMEMERVGIQVDVAYLERLGQEFQKEMQALEKIIFELAGESFNINSPKQLAVILFEKLKLPVVRKTKTGYSTDEEVLQTLSSKHALPQKLIQYRELQKLDSTYIAGLREGLHGSNHRIHGSFNQTVAATGRLSSSDPNLQNIPIRSELGRKIRRAFVPKEGTVLLAGDYSQIDLRVLAHVSKDPILCEAFRNGGDIHTITASEVLHVAPKDITPDQRRMAKSINFGIVYGISAFGLSQQLQISIDDAKSYIDAYFKRYAGVKVWIDQTLEEARKTGYVRTVSGRIRYLPEINSPNPQMRGFAERTAMNTPIQGTSADIIKLAMIRLCEPAVRKQWLGDMLVQVHDDLLFEIPKAALAASQRVIQTTMESSLTLDVPLVVDMKSGDNWADMKGAH